MNRQRLQKIAFLIHRQGNVCGGESSPGSALPGEQVPQGVVVVLIERGVDERVEEGVGVAQPQEDALPDGRDVAGAQRHDELGDEEGDPAKHEHADQDAHHQRRLLLLLFAPRVPVRLESHGGVSHGEHHLGPRLLLHLKIEPVNSATPVRTRQEIDLSIQQLLK